MSAFSKSLLNFKISKPSFAFLFFFFCSTCIWTQTLESPITLRHSLIVEYAFNKDNRLWNIKYDYAFRVKDKSTLGLQIGYMFGKEVGLVSYSPSGVERTFDPVKGIPVQFYALFGNPRGHNFEVGAEFYFPLEDFYSLTNLHMGYRFRPKEAGFTVGVHYKLLYQVFWVEHTVNISVGFIF